MCIVPDATIRADLRFELVFTIGLVCDGSTDAILAIEIPGVRLSRSGVCNWGLGSAIRRWGFKIKVLLIIFIMLTNLYFEVVKRSGWNNDSIEIFGKPFLGEILFIMFLNNLREVRTETHDEGMF